MNTTGLLILIFALVCVTIVNQVFALKEKTMAYLDFLMLLWLMGLFVY